MSGPVELETGAVVPWGAVDRALLAASSLETELVKAGETGFLSLVYLEEKAGNLMRALRSMGVRVEGEE